MDPHFIIPWVLALVTALWFGLLAHTARRNRFFWAVGGGFLALVSGTLIFGLGHAAAIPFSEAARTHLHMAWTLASIFIVLVLGWFMTIPLHPLRIVPWKTRSLPQPTAPAKPKGNR